MFGNMLVLYFLLLSTAMATIELNIPLEKAQSIFTDLQTPIESNESLVTPTEAKELSPPSAVSSSFRTCNIYDSKTFPKFNVTELCQITAKAQSTSGLFACSLQTDIINILQNCSDKDTFESEYIRTVAQKSNNIKSGDNWVIFATGVAFEPYTFEGVKFYAPVLDSAGLTTLPNLINFYDLQKKYNYYTECLQYFGKDCMWYHKGKEITYYEGTGGVWLIEELLDVNGFFYARKSFFAPVVIQGRFFGLNWVDVLAPQNTNQLQPQGPIFAP